MNMQFIPSNKEYIDMHFVSGFLDGNLNAAVEEYQQ
jgi:hypothetical protein